MLSKRPATGVTGDGGEREGAKRQRVFASASPYHVATVHRSFKLVVSGKPIFVSPHFMAEISPYFGTLCLGSFKEGTEGKAELKDVQYDDVIEMLDVLGVDYTKDRKEIDADNCLPMLKLATMWQVDFVLKKCVVFINTKFSHFSSTYKNTLELLLICEQSLVPLATLKHLGSRLASYGFEYLVGQKIFDQIGGRALGAAILSAAQGHTVAVSHPRAHQHDFNDWDDDRHLQAPEECSKPGCKETSVHKCYRCSVRFCDSHKERRTRDPSPSQMKSDVNVKLDDLFFEGTR